MSTQEELDQIARDFFERGYTAQDGELFDPLLTRLKSALRINSKLYLTVHVAQRVEALQAKAATRAASSSKAKRDLSGLRLTTKPRPMK